jgi:hypothetical protein
LDVGVFRKEGVAGGWDSDGNICANCHGVCICVALFGCEAAGIVRGEGDIVQQRVCAGRIQRQPAIPSVCLTIRSRGVGEAVEYGAANVAYGGGGEVDEGLGR